MQLTVERSTMDPFYFLILGTFTALLVIGVISCAVANRLDRLREQRRSAE